MRSDGATGNLMPKTMIKPGRDLLQRVNQAFLDHGYSVAHKQSSFSFVVRWIASLTLAMTVSSRKSAV